MSLQAKALRWSRIVAATAVWSICTTGLVSYGHTFTPAARWIERIQFLPAAMAFSLTVIVIWLIVSLLLGRIYCSVACPLGVYQDICARAPRMGRTVPQSRHYRYSPPLTPWRTVTLGLVIAAVLLAVPVVYTLADPWSIYERASITLARPVWGALIDLWTVPSVQIAAASAAGVTVSAVTIAIITVLAMRNGRTFCNTVCPVGTSLGFVSRYSLMHIDINTDLCTQCRRCEQVCKSACIDLVSHTVDGSRCVMCWDCLDACRDNAISYTWRHHQLSWPLMQRIDSIAAPAAGMDSAPTAHICSDHTENDKAAHLGKCADSSAQP